MLLSGSVEESFMLLDCLVEVWLQKSNFATSVSYYKIGFCTKCPGLEWWELEQDTVLRWVGFLPQWIRWTLVRKEKSYLAMGRLWFSWKSLARTNLVFMAQSHITRRPVMLFIITMGKHTRLHIARVTREYLDVVGIERFDWPDLNPIKHI